MNGFGGMQQRSPFGSPMGYPGMQGTMGNGLYQPSSFNNRGFGAGGFNGMGMDRGFGGPFAGGMQGPFGGPNAGFGGNGMMGGRPGMNGIGSPFGGMQA